MKSLKDIKKALKAMNITSENDPNGYEASMVLLSALIIGANADRISKFTKLPRTTVRKFGQNLTKSGIWKHGKTYANWLDPKDGGLEFLLATTVALGWIQRTEG